MTEATFSRAPSAHVSATVTNAQTRGALSRQAAGRVTATFSTTEPGP